MHTNQLQLLYKLAEEIKKEENRDPKIAKATLIKAKILNEEGQFTENYKHLDLLFSKK